ncbi:MAG: hypothetical protein ACRDIB_19925 [Ardenticatenaceae bacterium]
MAKFRKLSVEELVRTRSPISGERARIRREYKGYLEDLQVGEGGELTLTDEKKSTVKNRLKRAAEDLGMEIEFRRSAGGIVRFAVTSLGE